jgi:hypothetical protein
MIEVFPLLLLMKTGNGGSYEEGLSGGLGAESLDASVGPRTEGMGPQIVEGKEKHCYREAKKGDVFQNGSGDRRQASLSMSTC